MTALPISTKDEIDCEKRVNRNTGMEFFAIGILIISIVSIIGLVAVFVIVKRGNRRRQLIEDI